MVEHHLPALIGAHNRRPSVSQRRIAWNAFPENCSTGLCNSFSLSCLRSYRTIRSFDHRSDRFQKKMKIARTMGQCVCLFRLRYLTLLVQGEYWLWPDFSRSVLRPRGIDRAMAKNRCMHEFSNLKTSMPAVDLVQEPEPNRFGRNRAPALQGANQRIRYPSQNPMPLSHQS